MKRRITVLGLAATFVVSGGFVFTPASRADHCDRYGRSYYPGYAVGYYHRPAVVYRPVYRSWGYHHWHDHDDGPGIGAILLGGAAAYGAYRAYEDIRDRNHRHHDKDDD
jgi:hypothetical protein